MLKEEVIQKATEIFNGKYDYSLLGEVKTKKAKFPIICPEHGVFYKTYEHHIRRQQGCPKCAGKKRYTTEEFIDRCEKLEHTSEMSFEKTQYVNRHTKVKIFCHHRDNNGVEHGEFEITPSHLLTGEGCPKCRYIKSAAGKRRSTGEVIAAANEIHNGKYDYSLITEYKNDRTKYPIICSEHGVFYQTMNNHIKAKQGCPVCGRIKCDEARKDTFEDFIRKARLTHGDKYEYNDPNYVSTENKIGITCPEHGVFYMRPGNHIHGQGCPKCFREKSNVEQELFDFVKSLLPNKIVEENNRTILDGKEIDVYIPSLKIGFEMNGLVWHSDKFGNDINYHLNKTEECLKQGIRLIHIFEDEWLEKKEICKSHIKTLLDVVDNKIYARDCQIQTLKYDEVSKFMEANHIQGPTTANIYIGLYYNDELVEIMALNKKRKNEGHYKLTRICNKLNTIIIGGTSKLFNYFVKNCLPKSVIAYEDRRWSYGNIYDTLGFKLINISKPNYSYIIGKKRINKSNLRKNILVSNYECPPEMTVDEFCHSKNWFRIYDCGYLCYRWNNENN